jgi:hypothetical protein
MLILAPTSIAITLAGVASNAPPFEVTREINDGLLAPRFARSQRAWVLTGFLVSVNPAVPASEGRDADDR